MLDPNPSEKVKSGPHCPQCGERRSIECPYCHTMGGDFKSAAMSESDFGKIFGLSASAEEAACCGPGGCKGTRKASSELSPTESAYAAVPMVICPICDEPFEPRYLRRCGECGHEFADGIEPANADRPNESSGLRIAACVAAILVSVAGALWYYARLFR